MNDMGLRGRGGEERASDALSLSVPNDTSHSPSQSRDPVGRRKKWGRLTIPLFPGTEVKKKSRIFAGWKRGGGGGACGQK